jgi:hypothetical protein
VLRRVTGLGRERNSQGYSSPVVPMRREEGQDLLRVERDLDTANKRRSWGLYSMGSTNGSAVGVGRTLSRGRGMVAGAE